MLSGQNGEYQVTMDGRAVGSLSVFQQGPFTVFDCTCRSSERDVLRLAAVCGGKYVPIGVMVPEGGVLRLKKSFSRNALAETGYSPTASFRLVKKDELQKGAEETPAPPQAVPGFAGTDEPGGDMPESSAPETIPPAEAASDKHPGASDTPTNADAHGENAAGTGETLDLPQETSLMDDLPGGMADENAEGGCESGPDEALTVDKLAALSRWLEGYRALNMPEEVAGHAVANEFTAETGEGKESGATAGDAGEGGELSEPVAPDGWRPVHNVGALFADLEVRESCAGVRGAIAAEDGEFMLLAVPLSPDEPFPLMPVFCFGSYAEIGGREYIVFKIKNGNLAL